MNAYYHLLKAYIYVTNIFKRMFLQLFISVLTVISAGPVGNIRTLFPPPPGREYRYSMFLYFLQTLLLIPLLIVFFHPLLISVTLIILRLIDTFQGVEQGPHTPSFIIYIVMVIIALDFHLAYWGIVSTGFEMCFAYVNPFKFPVFVFMKVKELLRLLYNTIAGPLMRGGKGAAHYIKLFASKTTDVFAVLADKLSKGVTHVAFIVYNSTKAML